MGGSLPYPRWLAKVNRVVFNPSQVRKGKRPILTHAGRTSGTTYQTPMDAHPTRNGFVLVVRYGPESDWVLNALAAGSGSLAVGGHKHELVKPRLVTQEDATAELNPGYEPGADFYKAEHYLLFDADV